MSNSFTYFQTSFPSPHFSFIFYSFLVFVVFFFQSPVGQLSEIIVKLNLRGTKLAQVKRPGMTLIAPIRLKREINFIILDLSDHVAT